MRICFVGPANSSHIVKWCTWFANRGHEVHVISFSEGDIPCANIHIIDTGFIAAKNDIVKLKYLLTGKRISFLINEIKPDIVNVHYATSYGTALALSGVNDYVLSVWGSDIYDFPKKSPFHKMLIKYSLKKAKYLFSTSQAMADEAGKYTDKEFKITPFGVDMDLFNPNKRTREKDDKDFIVGTVKGLSEKYGISYILRAVAEIKEQGNIPIKLRIAGKGPQEQEYKKLAVELGINSDTTWLGFISQEEAAKEWANMDVAVIPSTEYESFGVAAVEAQASGTPVIVSQVEGLLESTYPNHSSKVVPKRNAEAISEMLLQFYHDRNLCHQMGLEGRNYVLKKYEINHCFERIERMFIKIWRKSLL